jgi:hypothetical protein
MQYSREPIATGTTRRESPDDRVRRITIVAPRDRRSAALPSHVLQVSAADVETGDIVAGVIAPAPATGITSVTARSLFLADADAVRDRLDAGLADSARLPRARADGAELALRAASALVANGGGTSILSSPPAQLLARAAIFTPIAASRPELKLALVAGFSRRRG